MGLAGRFDTSNRPEEIFLSFRQRRLAAQWNCPVLAKAVILSGHLKSLASEIRQQELEHVLESQGFGTLAFNLLTEKESQYRLNTFDMELLTERLLTAADWARSRIMKQNQKLGLVFLGHGLAAAVALTAAARHPTNLVAVVAIDGRTDLAAPYLRQVEVPTLLVVETSDPVLLNWNRSAQRDLAHSELKVVSNLALPTDEFVGDWLIHQSTQRPLEWLSEATGPN